jgi:3-deoxy-D-manno-octulosonic-acid transferase
MFWQFFYNSIVIPIEWIGFHLLGLINKKAARGIRGRKGLWKKLEADIAHLDSGKKRIWFHSSSMGEFEQAKPIIAELKRGHPEIHIIVSFFSPSGYEHSLSYKLADVITYLPFDSNRNAEKFVHMIMPAAAVIVRYDVWPNHVWALRRAGVPIFIANATLQSNTLRRMAFFKQFHAYLYNALDFILTVSDKDLKTFESFGAKHPLLETIGDTRYDQVWQRSAESKRRRVLDTKIIEGKKVLVIGSSWKEDEERLLPACFELVQNHPQFLVILVPHEPTLETLDRIENELNGHASHIRFSNLSQYNSEQIVIIDSVGILMPLYQYASVAYVGGSFHSGIHNVLEPAAYGIPIIFGPEHGNSQEAIELVKRGAAFVGRDSRELHQQIQFLLDDEVVRQRAGEQALNWVNSNIGATARCLSYLEKVL